jgi:hypothetical protein
MEVMINTHKIIVRKCDEKRPLGRARPKLENYYRRV